MLAQQRQRHRSLEEKLAHHAVSARVLPAPTRAPPQREALEAHWIPMFQDLGVGDAGVGHMRVHGARAVEVAPRAAATRGDRFRVFPVPLPTIGT